ncbi:protein of unknown function [Magnetospira sp. QH-2]|nr:protein of unknown function [Magnetospira sp. QH-2]
MATGRILEDPARFVCSPFRVLAWISGLARVGFNWTRHALRGASRPLTVAPLRPARHSCP